MNNSLRSVGTGLAMLTSACAAHSPAPKVQHPVVEQKAQAPVVSEDGGLQISAVAERINSNCGEISSRPAMVPRLGYTPANPDAAVFTGVTREQLECVVDAAMDPENGPKVCMPMVVKDMGGSADIMVRCVDRGDLDK